MKGKMMRTTKVRYIFLLLAVKLFLSTALHAFAQVKNTGIPSFKNFTRKDYGAGTQNWSMDQDGRGIMYFANNSGLLSYDGSFWNLHPVPNQSVVRCVKIDNSGKIFVGAYNEFGYFFPGKNGSLRYFSLSKSLPSAFKDFGEIWKIHIIDENVYFQSFTDLFLYEEGDITNVVSNKNFRFSFYVNHQLFINDREKGIYQLKNDSLVWVNGSEIFSNKEIWTILPYHEEILIGTLENGFYLYDDVQFSAWNSKASEFCKKNQIFSAVYINDDTYAIGSIQDGMIVINRKGQIIQHLNSDIGIQNNTVLSVFSDQNNNLWLGLDNGIDYVKISSPVYFYGKKKEIGAGYASVIHQGNIYIGTNQGLFYKAWNPTNKSVESYDFTMVEGTRGQVWSLKAIGNELYCGHDKGAFHIQEGQAKILTKNPGVWDFITVPDNPEKIIAGTYTDLLLFEKQDNGVLEMKEIIGGFSESSREMVFNNNILWMSHGYKGVYKIKFNKTYNQVDDFQLYGKKDGFPSDYGITVHEFKNELVFSTDSGIYQYDSEQDSFYTHHYLTGLLGKDKVNKKFYEDNSGNIWFFQNDQLKILRLKYDGSYEKETVPFLELKETFIYSFENMHIHDNSNILVGTEFGLIHFSPFLINYQRPELNTLIRRISTNEDSIIFGGNFVNEDTIVISNRPSFQIHHIDYKFNDLHFSFSSPDYKNFGNVQYQLMLDGYDKTWSKFYESSTKEYTNLFEGSYIFKVRSKNILGEVSNVSSYEFVINPPWYRSTWAYVFYGIMLILTVYAIYKYYTKRFEREKEQLKKRQQEAMERQQQEHKDKVLMAEQEIVNLQNEKLELEVERNKAELENKSKELASIAMQINYKNEILEKIKTKLSRVANKMVHEDSIHQVKTLIKTIDQEMHKEEDWEKFEVHFDQVHENFIQSLKSAYPQLTPKDLKLAAYLRMNLATKEIAPLLNISVRGVEISRYRLRKKLNLEKGVNLTDFFLKF